MSIFEIFKIEFVQSFEPRIALYAKPNLQGWIVTISAHCLWNRLFLQNVSNIASNKRIFPLFKSRYKTKNISNGVTNCSKIVCKKWSCTRFSIVFKFAIKNLFFSFSTNMLFYWSNEWSKQFLRGFVLTPHVKATV